MTNRKLKWTLWTKPYSKTKPEFTSEDELEAVTVGTSRWKDSYTEDDDDDDNDNKVLVIPTNQGLLPLKMYQNFPKNFPIYVAHTNFEVDENVKEQVCKVPGVILFKESSRYEFRVAFGNLFDSKKVRLAIQSSLGAYPRLQGENNPRDLKLPISLKTKITSLIEDLQKISYWSIFVLPNGEYDFVSTIDEVEFRGLYSIHQEVQGVTGAIIYSSVDTD
jgi:hypothetical protein